MQRLLALRHVPVSDDHVGLNPEDVAVRLPPVERGIAEPVEVLPPEGQGLTTVAPDSFREGVVYVPELNVDAFFVTLKKSEADYSPTTMYRDPISPTLFHWESQSTTTVASPTGQRYVNGTSTVLLLVREQAKDDFGTAPYLFLGPATHVEHAGERPIAITWRLDNPMPSDFFQMASVAAG